VHEPFEAVTDLVYVATLLESGLRGEALMVQLPEALCQRLEINWQRMEGCLPQAEQLDALANLMLDA
jgi:hypothetical protein